MDTSRTGSLIAPLVAAALAGGIAGGCKFPDLPPIEDDAAVDHAVGGTVEGLWTGAALELRLDVAGREPQRLTVDREGSFVFPERLLSDTSFALAIESDADQHDCTVETPAGAVGVLDVTNLRIHCTSQIAITLALSTLQPFTFDAQISRHELDASVLLGQLAVTLGGPVGTTATFNGSPISPAVPSSPVILAMGVNTLALDVTVGALSRRYELVVNRGAVQPAEYFYAKAAHRDAEDFAGFSIATSGDFVVIGAPFEDSSNFNNPDNDSVADSGAALVFQRDGSEVMFLKGSQAMSGESLGMSTAASDEWFVAGAPNDLGAQPGAVHIWRRSGTGWDGQERKTASNATNADAYGSSVDVLGDTMAVGAANGIGGMGAVYIYRQVSSWNWVEEAILRPPNARSGDRFGQTISLGPDVIAIGAPYEGSSTTGVSTTPATDQGAVPSGAVYVYRRKGTTWTLEAYVKASNTGQYDNFGMALDLDGDTLVIAAPVEESGSLDQQDNSVSGAGAVYVFRRVNATWAQEAYVKAPLPMRMDLFGSSLALRGDTLAIGAIEHLERNGPGSVYIFNRAGATWGLVARVMASNANPNDRFHTVALGPDGLYVGAPCESSQSTPSDNDLHCSGAAYFFR